MHLELFQSFYRFRYSFEKTRDYGAFWNIFESFAEITKTDRLLKTNIDQQINTNIERRIIDADRRRTIRENQHLKKSQVSPKTPIIAP